MESEEAAAAAGLATAGLEVLEISAAASDWTVPAEAAWMATACTSEDGRVDRLIDFDDANLVENANTAWHTLARDFRLFGENGTFLVSVNIGDRPPQWALVRLAAHWDLIGAGTENGALGGPRGRPGFVMSSTNGDVVVAGTTWSESVGILAVPKPHQASAIRRYAVGMVKSAQLPPDDARKIRGWLGIA